MKRFACVVALLASGCVGQILGGGSSDDDDGPDDGPRNLCDGAEADVAGPRLLRRLTSPELTASIRYAFGLSSAEWAGPAVPADPASADGFTNNVDRLVVDESYARGLYATATGVADVVVSDAILPRVLPCSGAGGADCARTFLDTVGRRLYRRPLSDAEIARFLELHDRVAPAEGFAEFVRVATAAMVQSPNFLYRSELGEPDGDGYRLTGYEIATALAFALTGAPPDDALLDAAARGDLDTSSGIAAAADALAAQPQHRVVFHAFADRWLGLSSLPNLVKVDAAFTPEVREAMRRETEAFVDQIVFEQRGGVADLLTSPVSVVDPVLAAYYGWGGGGVTPRPDGWGVGLLAQGSVLAVNAGNEHTSPTQRGLLVRERLLCQDMPPPPPVVGDIPAPTGSETTRERYEAHSADPACSGCHQLMDPIGFAFEKMDAGGRYRELENGLPIDDTGGIHSFDGPGPTVTGPTELASALASLPEPATCMASFMAADVYGLDHHDTSCLITSLAEDLAAGELAIADFYVALTSTNHFMRRRD